MSDDTLRVVFGSTERRGVWTVPAKLDVRVMMGSAVIDLREATLGPGVTTIDVRVMMGNVEIIVPPELRVDVGMQCVAASVEETRRLVRRERQSKAAADPAGPRVRIIGKARLASCEVLAMKVGETRRDLARQLRNERHRHHHEHHRERHERHRERIAAWHAERELWHMEGPRWRPWWLRARMRRRIFLWFGIALAIGTFAGTRMQSGHPHWWIIPGLIVLWMASGAVAWRMTRPLIIAIKAARDIGEGRLDTRLDPNRHGGEMKVLALALNEMAARIEQQLKDQRQLLAAVSHELRTPLGHMRVLIETARESNDRKALAELDREVMTLDDLVGKLLAQSRLEFGNLDRRPLDLGELVSDVATSAGIAPEHIEAIGEVKADADPTLIRRAVANLIDNARVHGGGAVAVRIERRAGQIAIEVDDAGPGVPADRRADAFRAFVPSSGGGLGLGLALVSRIAVAHDGGAWIDDRPGGGARVGFTISA